MDGIEGGVEIIVVDDGTVDSGGRLNPITPKDFNHTNIKVINNGSVFGVGWSFDRGVEIASGDIICLCGSDIFVRKRSWLSDVLRYATDNEIGCSASVGLSGDQRDLDHEKRYVRYGADLLFMVANDDLPRNSLLRQLRGGYSALFEAKWKRKEHDEPYEIPCVLGAFYFTTKKFYEKIHGWDTEKNVRYIGHQGWGSLEPYLSLKTRLYGGKCVVYPDFEVGHVFGRLPNGARSNRADLHWFNRLFMVHTMTDNPLKEELLNYPHKDYTFNIAEKYIQEHWSNVLKVRERNIRESNGLITQR
jgi:glycosyltransferase involved in cell wall biosynthesis